MPHADAARVRVVTYHAAVALPDRPRGRDWHHITEASTGGGPSYGRRADRGSRGSVPGAFFSAWSDPHDFVCRFVAATRNLRGYGRDAGSPVKSVGCSTTGRAIPPARRALGRVGADVAVTSDTEAAIDADSLVVPGVDASRRAWPGLPRWMAAAIVERHVRPPGAGESAWHAGSLLMRASARRGPLVWACCASGRRLRRRYCTHGWNTVTRRLARCHRRYRRTRFYFVHSAAVTTPAGSATHAAGIRRRGRGRRHQRDAVSSREIRRLRRHIAIELAGHAVTRAQLSHSVVRGIR
jgi:hypothetical protein